MEQEKRKCKNCGIEMKFKRSSKVFCSGKCRVAHSRQNSPKKKEAITPLQMQVLYNSVLEMVGKINYGQVPTILDAPKVKAINDEPLSFAKMEQEIKQPSQLESWKKDMNACEDMYELERITALMKKDTSLVWNEKNELERYGMQVYRQKGFS